MCGDAMRIKTRMLWMLTSAFLAGTACTDGDDDDDNGGGGSSSSSGGGGSSSLASSGPAGSSSTALPSSGTNASSAAPASSAAGSSSVATASSAGGSSSATTASSAAGSSSSAAQPATIQVLHGSPGAPAVDVRATGVTDPLIANLAYGSADTIQVPAGTYALQVFAAGTTTNPVTSASVTVAAGGSYFVAAAGTVGGTGTDALGLRVFENGFATPAASTVRARILHAGVDAPTVEVDPGDDATAPFITVARYEATDAAGVELPSGTKLQVGIRNAQADGARVTAFTTPELPALASFWIVADGLLASRPGATDGFKLFAVLPDDTVLPLAQNPVIYALHASPGAPAVDIFAGAAEVISGITYGTAAALSAPVQIAPATVTLDLFAAEAGSTRPAGNPVFSATLDVMAGNRYLAVATGILSGSPAFTVVPVVEGFAAHTATEASLVFVHAAPGVNAAVDVGVADGTMLTGTPLFADVGFGATSATTGLVLPSSTSSLVLGVALTGATPTAATFTLAGGIPAANLFAVALGGNGESVALGLLNTSTGAGPWTFAVVPSNP